MRVVARPTPSAPPPVAKPWRQDTMAMKGAGATQGTYTLLRKSIRKLLKQSAYAAAAKQRGAVAGNHGAARDYWLGWRPASAARARA